MIEVTDEMVDAAALAFTNKPTEATYVNARRMITAAIKTYEANKPKPEPVAYMTVFEDGSIAKLCRNETIAACWGLPYQPLYTTPPTREPLSECELREILNNLNEGDGSIYDFARAVEKAHGIGVTK